MTPRRGPDRIERERQAALRQPGCEWCENGYRVIIGRLPASRYHVVAGVTQPCEADAR